MTNAVIYARYSAGADQTEASIEGQLRECRDFAEHNKYRIVKEYVDRAISGTSDKRPDFQSMIRDAESRCFEVIIVWKLDRFARNRYDSAVYKARLKKCGVRVMSAKENISDAPEGVILESVLEGMAEYYSLNLAQNIRRGMTDAAMKCRVASSLPIGFRASPEKTYEIDPAGAEIVRSVFEKYAAGWTLTAILDSLNSNGIRTPRGVKFGHHTIQTILRNEKYVGVYTWDSIRIPNGIPRIISDELWTSTQKRLQLQGGRKMNARAKAKVVYLLSGKIHCGDCDSPMCGESGVGKSGRTYHYYKCSSAKKGTGCSRRSVRREWIEDQVISETINTVLTTETIDHIAEAIANLQDAESNTDVLQSLESQLRGTKRAVANLVKAMERVDSSAIDDRLRELETQKQDLENRLALETAVKPRLTKEQIAFWLEKFRGGDVNDQEYQDKLIDTFISGVWVFEDRLIITYNYSGHGGRPQRAELTIGPECSSGGVRIPPDWWTVYPCIRTLFYFTGGFGLEIRAKM